MQRIFFRFGLGTYLETVPEPISCHTLCAESSQYSCSGPPPWIFSSIKLRLRTLFYSSHTKIEGFRRSSEKLLERYFNIIHYSLKGHFFHLPRPIVHFPTFLVACCFTHNFFLFQCYSTSSSLTCKQRCFRNMPVLIFFKNQFQQNWINCFTKWIHFSTSST